MIDVDKDYRIESIVIGNRSIVPKDGVIWRHTGLENDWFRCEDGDMWNDEDEGAVIDFYAPAVTMIRHVPVQLAEESAEIIPLAA